MPRIRLPNGWQPRPYQRKLWNYLEGGGKRGVWIAHRRAGKDDLAMHWTAVAAHGRVGTYWHMLPEAAQARKAIWEAINPHTGKRRIDEAFPRELRDGTRENEMFMRFKCGSTWQVLGSDNYNSLVGSPPIGLVMSEYALADPNAWGYMRPILRENGGWAAFITTPRGRNHAYTMYEAAREDPEWFAELLPATETGVFSEHDLAAERREMMREYGPDDGQARYEQEYLCSWSAGMLGAYYARQMDDAEKEGRITNVPHDPRLPVHTAWDLGIGDAHAIWMTQVAGAEIRVIDYIENSGVGLDWYARELDKRPYKWGEHILPHDIEVKELGTGKTRLEVLNSLGIRNTRVIPAQSVDEGINALRMLLPRMWFDKVKAVRVVECMRAYHRAWDDKRRTYQDRPYHDWSSHCCDAGRYYALAEPRNAGPAKQLKYPNMAYA